MQPNKAEIDKILSEVVPFYIEKGTEGWLQFMRDELKYTPDTILEPVVDDIANYRDTAVKSAHGVGKTTIGGNILQTALVLVPNLFIMQISPTWSQVKDVFWNELRRWYNNSPIMNSLFELADKSPRLTSYVSPEVWRAHGIASNSPGKVEGRHNEKRIFKIVDEAKAVEDGIDEATEGAMTAPLAWRLKLSTPSTPGGRFTHFYHCFSKDRKFWKTHSIPAWKSSRVPKTWTDRMERFGKDSQIYKARVAAEFPDASGNILIPLQVAERFYAKDHVSSGAVALGIDVARFGEDESVISIWRGETMIGLRVVKVPDEKKKTTEISREAKGMAAEFGARAIVIDDVGVGGGVTDQLADHFEESQLMTIVPFISNAEAPDSSHYKSLADQVLTEFAEAMKTEAIKSTVEDDVLIYQLSSYKKLYTASEHIIVKWPDSTKDRSADEKSPDRADAAFMGWYGSRLLIGAGITDKKDVNSENPNDEDDDAPRHEFRGLKKKLF